MGFIENIFLQSLDITRVHISDEVDIDCEYRFLTSNGNIISLKQEISRVLQSIVRRAEDGYLHVFIRKVQI